MIELGGNIKLSGFKELEPAHLVVIKKIVGNYAKKINEQIGDFQELSLTLKKVHESKHEIKAKLVLDEKIFASEVTDFNLFIVLDKVLDKLLEEAKL